MSKLKTITTIKRIANRLKKEKKRIVFTNGCFDLLHPGHIKLLRDAKKNGNILIVGLNSDSSIKKIKGKKRPIMPQGSRAEVLSALELVDYVVIFTEKTPYNLIKEIKPHVLVKGSDWGENQIIGSELVKKIVRVKLFGGYSTTKIIEKITKNE
ncbi:MAG: D-glycero-beta-D-manno-heptose 1-phosphate adenylyltransferase [Candidatus Omnitrophica bacterium]|nr:D-glycero-beta-D-manno-heptose 1-phosphate adenylyltransferase [Candidatus Omnitrophota bacterium]